MVGGETRQCALYRADRSICLCAVNDELSVERTGSDLSSDAYRGTCRGIKAGTVPGKNAAGLAQ